MKINLWNIRTILKGQDWGGFVLNLLSVVLGIVITFWGDAIIRDHNDRMDLNKTLELVRDELRSNVDDLKALDQTMQLQGAAARYLKQYYGRFDQCDPDSMRLYCNAPLSIFTYEVSRDALELLKTSSLLQKIEDKELALNIISVYNVLAVEQKGIEFYNEKIQRLIAEANQTRMKALFARQTYTAVEMWDAITSTNEGRNFLNEIIVSNEISYNTPATIEYVQGVIDAIVEQ